MIQTIREKPGMKMMALFLVLVLLSSFFPWQIVAQESLEIPKQVIVVKNEMSEPIEGAVFEIQNQKKEIMETCISDENGRAEIFQAEDGIYQLVQVKTQQGYVVIREQPIEIKTQNPIREETVINGLALSEPEIIPETQEGAAKAEEPLITDENKPESDASIHEASEESIETRAIDSVAAMVALDSITVKINRDVSNPTQIILSTVGYAGKTGIGNVLFPTWSEHNGQDDIRWYQGTLGSNGEFSVSVDIKDHGFETGSYNVHTYIYGLRGEVLNFYTNTFNQAAPSPGIKVSEIVNNSYKITLTGASNAQGVTGVSFPTWSNTNGQDDIRWETGTYVGNDTWEATVNLKDYKQTYDTFTSHAYVIDTTGKMNYISAVEKTIKSPLTEIAIAVAQVPGNPTQFTVSTVGCVGKTGIGNVLFPTWSEKNGQDDIQWSQGILGSNGEYSVTIDNKDHGFETGSYNVHTYIYGLRGEVLNFYTNTFNQAAPSPGIKVSEVANNSYKITLTGASNAQGVTGVSFPTWSNTNGQDDIHWEMGTYVGNDTWEATVNLKNYNASYDTFVSHAYVIDKSEKYNYVGSTEKIITNPFVKTPAQIGGIKDSDVSKFKISTNNCSNQTGVKKVSFAVWTNRNGQDDVQWFPGTLGTIGEYTALIDIDSHGFETGPYIIHAYLYGNGGENIAFANNTYTMEKITPTIEYDKAVLNNTFKIRIKNVGNENGVGSIVFPTWSKTNGQDDISWEQGTYIGNHTWEASINLRNYNIIVDDFVTHAYLADKNGKMVMAQSSVKTILQNTSTIYGYFNYPLDKGYKPNPSDPTDWFGPRWGSIHEGIDIPAPYYANCYSPGDGVIEKAGYFMGYGRYVRIRMTDRYGESVSFFYGHLQEINVSVGQTVTKGQLVGKVGGSGYDANGRYIDDAYGPHLHFGAIANADFACVDPEIWIDFHNPYSNLK
ncbi:GBS Bsp-like repeat-containing protein [Acetobacterium bakii]|uniref:Peptidase M23 domain-containing protein n=1 Tax=Acetobacterium bakii TaxID=52689 RepID=A0A0L6U5L4_9FIRM|nr:GBS Bsp-like repeat-containing protein [Acetobacterium bakii]KNZ43085.1 hypothetical protein AKG39_02710 [Acetobacterium bakii]